MKRSNRHTNNSNFLGCLGLILGIIILIASVAFAPYLCAGGIVLLAILMVIRVISNGLLTQSN